MQVQYETKAYVAFKRGSKGVFDQTPNTVFTPGKNDAVEINHKISRETVFYTSNGGKSYDSKSATFQIMGRNPNTKNQVVEIASITIDISKYVGTPAEQVINFKNSKAKDTSIVVDWDINTELAPQDLTEEDLRNPSVATGSLLA